ncbi:DMT family transporter [Fimbriiglobus ruber]|uniref:Permease of the drug/metabolite transporter (DMT) superfamily n=1 Tax=Fimbriiglobus ruber TaxID=1908690 RepID=A0A225E792_9BACT|nr:DMT family transporter [Fimbriiglobus ruber]OWK46658.1 Permease of the drug/metabolite transporter (DMT) superfamily [Fimbriiglobus ruber]
MSNAGIRPYAWMMCGCLWFSVMAILSHSLAGECDWQLVAAARSGLATLFALTMALATGAKLVFRRPGILWVRSLAGSCSMVATFYALTRPGFPVSDVLTLTNTFPIWVAILSWPVTGERPSFGVWVAVGCAVAGVALTQRPHLNGFPPAAWAALGGSLFTAVAMLGLDRLRGVSSLGIVVHFSAVSMAFCGGAFLLSGNMADLSWASNPTVPWKLLGVGATATVGQVFLTLAFRSGSATRVAVVGLSQVVMVLLLEVALPETAGGKRLDWVTLAGTVLILGPTAWVMTRAARAPVAGTADKDVAIEQVVG